MSPMYERPVRTLIETDLFIEVTTSMSALALMKDEWNTLLEQSVYPSVYMRFEYVESGIRHLSRPGDELFIIGIRDQLTQSLTAIFPMKLRRLKRYSIGLRMLEYAVTREIDKPFPIIKQGWESRVWPTFSSFVARMTPEWDIMEFMEVPDSTTLRDDLKVCFSGSKHTIQVGPPKESHLIDLHRPWSLVWDRHVHMRRIYRKMARDFGVGFSYDIKGCLNDPDSGLDTYIDLELRSWKHGRVGISKSAEITRFYRGLFRDFCQLGLVKIGFLYLNGVAIAGEIAYVYRGNVYFAHGSFDDEYRKYSPGLVSKALFLKSFHEQGYRTGDYLAGYAGYLKNWSTETVFCQDVRVIRKCAKVRIYLALRWIAKVPVRRLRERFVSIAGSGRPADENTPA